MSRSGLVNTAWQTLPELERAGELSTHGDLPSLSKKSHLPDNVDDPITRGQTLLAVAWALVGGLVRAPTDGPSSPGAWEDSAKKAAGVMSASRPRRCILSRQVQLFLHCCPVELGHRSERYPPRLLAQDSKAKSRLLDGRRARTKLRARRSGWAQQHPPNLSQENSTPASILSVHDTITLQNLDRH
jgi:hypothetical protein